MKIRIKKMLKKISFMFRYKHVHHYIQEKNIKGLLLLKNEKNISEYDYTCIHVSYKDNCSDL